MPHLDDVRDSLRRKPSETTGKGVERAQEILVAAQEAFALDGYAALTMRGVAARTGVTLGSVQHYYKTRNELLEAMLVHSTNEWQGSVDRIIAAMPDAPGHERFLAAMTYFIHEMRRPVTRGLLLELQGLARRNEFAARVSEQLIERARRTLRRLLRDVVVDTGEQLDRRAGIVLTMILGLLFGAPRDHKHAEISDAIVQEALLGIATGPVSQSSPPPVVRT